MEYCESHMEMVKHIAEIRTKLEQIDEKIDLTIQPMKNHIEQGDRWRIAIIGIVFAGILQVITFAYMWGSLNAQVNINTARWERVIQQGGFK